MRLSHSILLALASLFLFSGFSAQAASFDCGRAGSWAEKAICADPELSAADESLAPLYKAAKERMKNSHEFRMIMRSNLQMRERCRTKQCLRHWYEDSAELYKKMAKAGVQLTGELVVGAAPDPAKEDGSEVRFAALKTAEPVTVRDEELGEASATLLQIAVSDERMQALLQKNMGRRVRITCREVFRADNAHHLTPVLCFDPSAVAPAD
jgi:uncharacterized protein